MDAVVFAALALLAGGGLALLAHGLLNIRAAVASERWPTAAGMVLPTQVEVSRSSDGSATFSPNVLVPYSAAGVYCLRIRESRTIELCW